MATETAIQLRDMHQTWAKAGWIESSQYRPYTCVTVAIMVVEIRTKQYWKMQTQIIYSTVSPLSLQSRARVFLDRVF
jgi:hypothetical protein